ncbi:MAG: hypothetical protein HYY76_08935 [Acidobacteria bacterium]|nr:hypothetical protein [Acidobacteriota bacterium]
MGALRLLRHGHHAAREGAPRRFERRARRGVAVALKARLERISMRLHVRAIIRDGEAMFVGSQSLRTLELDARREVGLIARDPAAVRRLQETFEEDWAQTELGRKEQKQFEKDQKLALADDVAVVIRDLGG